MRPKIGINGFGRIGRTVARIILKRELELKAINDPYMPVDYLAYLLRHDSTYGLYPGQICVGDKFITVDDRKIMVTNVAIPNEIPWKKSEAEYIVESSGLLRTMDLASEHRKGGAKKVIVTALSDDIPMFLCGVNLEKYRFDDDVVSNGSCTTNCAAALARVINTCFGIEEALVTSIYATTAIQRPVDMAKKRAWRDGRGCMQNLIPALTEDAKAVAKVIPDLANKISGLAIRVPVPNASVVDFTCTTNRPVDMFKIMDQVRSASEGVMKGVIGFTEDAVVSTDFRGDTRSAILDVKASIILHPNLVKLIAWYDNEYGYASRVVDLVEHMYKEDNDGLPSTKEHFKIHDIGAKCKPKVKKCPPAGYSDDKC